MPGVRRLYYGSGVRGYFAIPVGATQQQNFLATWGSGTQYNLTGSSTWSSNNTTVATVNTGLVTGINVGSPVITVYVDGVPVQAGTYTGNFGCPTTNFSQGSSGTVMPKVTFSGTPVVPSGHFAPITATVSPSGNTTPITLTLATTSGSGQALFYVNGNSVASMTITTTTILTIQGAVPSSSQNNISLTATVTANSQQITVGSTTLTVGNTNGGALPVNFIQTGATVLSNAYLQFTYTWGSSSGVASDISQCQVREFVTYPGYVSGQQLKYYWTNPPYVSNTYTPNPETGEQGPASGVGLTHVQGRRASCRPTRQTPLPPTRFINSNVPTTKVINGFSSPHRVGQSPSPGWSRKLVTHGSTPLPSRVYRVLATLP